MTLSLGLTLTTYPTHRRTALPALVNWRRVVDRQRRGVGGRVAIDGWYQSSYLWCHGQGMFVDVGRVFSDAVVDFTGLYRVNLVRAQTVTSTYLNPSQSGSSLLYGPNG